jgi:GNAT superfamily N-acetyltransferase
VIAVRIATPADLRFVGQDGYLEARALVRKVEAGEVYIAEDASGPVGYLRLEYLWSTQPYIALIRVLEPHRRRGAGRALLGRVEEDLRRAGHAALLSSSQADEPQPQAWHRHMGFVDCGAITGLNEGGVDEVFFRKAL